MSKKNQSIRNQSSAQLVKKVGNLYLSSPQIQKAPAFIKQLNKPLLSVAMMVKDEEEFLEDALKSAQNIADEIIVVDTGSKDRTVEIARAYQTKISFYEWKNDFSDARNETIRKSNGEWIFILDADERIVAKDPKYFQDLRNQLVPREKYPYEGFLLNVINQRLDGSEMNSLHSVRIFPKHDHINYMNRVHNQLGIHSPNPNDPKELSLRIYHDVHLVHLGYDPIVYARRKKTERSLPLIEEMVKENPENYIYRFYLGREYVINKKYSQAIDILEETMIVLFDDPKKGYFEETLKTLLFAYESANALQNDLNKTLILAEAGIAHAPEQPDFWFYHAYVHAIQNQLAKAAESIEKCVSTLENFRMVHAGQSNPYLLNIPWKVYALAAEIFWYLNRYDQAYPYFLKTISLKPESEDGWPFILNSACAIAIENNDESKLPILLEKLIVMPNVPLDMFFLRVQNLIDQNQNTKAKELLIWAKRKSSRLRKDEQFNSYCEKFDI